MWERRSKSDFITSSRGLVRLSIEPFTSSWHSVLSCYEPNSSCSTTPSVGSIVGESGGEAPSGEGSTTRARLDSSPTVHVRFPVSAAFVVVVVVSYVSRIGSSRAVLLLSRFPEHSFTGNEVSAKFIG